MKPRDLLIVTSKFWPHSGLTEIALGELAINLSKAGHNVTIATVQWSREWSECIHYQGIPVIRFARPVAGPWSSFRYARSLAKHFTTDSYDAVIVAGMSDEATAVFKTVDEYTPVLCYVDEGHLDKFNESSRKKVGNLMVADAVIATSDCVADVLSELNVDHINVIGPGIRKDNRETDDPLRIRASLSKAHAVLAIEPGESLVVCCTPMDERNQISDLVSAWSLVLQEFPKAKLWLVGDGPNANFIWQQILDMDMPYNVLMPGYLDQMVDLYAAADLYANANGSNEAGDGLVRALACGTAAVAAENKYTKRFLQHSQNGLLFEPRNIESMASAIIKGLSNPHWRKNAGNEAKNQLSDQFLPDQQVARYIALINSLSDQLVETAQ